MTPTIRHLLVLTGLTVPHIHHIAGELTLPTRQGRPRALPLSSRIVPTAAALRTNLTVRQLAAMFGISKSQAHRIITDLTPRLAGLLPGTVDADRRFSWTVDGTLIPTRDKAAAARSKNYRYAHLLPRSCPDEQTCSSSPSPVAVPATATTRSTTRLRCRAAMS